MKKLTILVFLLAIPLTVFPQSKVGTAGLQFLQVGVGARAFGMSEAFVAIADDVTALYYNPAGIALLEGSEAIAARTAYPADINIDYLGYARSLSPFDAVGASLTILSLGEDLLETDNRYPTGTGRSFSFGDYAFGLTYARKLTPQFSAGVTLKVLYEYLADEEVFGFAGDVGTIYDTEFKSLKVAMSITNFGPDLTYTRDSFPLPLNFKVGISALPIDTEDHRLLVDVEGSHPNDNFERGIIGMEYGFNDLFFLRGGVKWGVRWDTFEEEEGILQPKTKFGIGTDTEKWSAGTGFKIPVNVLDIKLDYAATDFGTLGILHRLSLGIAWK